MLDIPLEGRKATVMFDSDMLRKWQVKLAAGRLAEYLQGRGAEPYVTYFHDLPDGSKCGADDFFAAGGKFSELRLLTRRYHPDDFERVRLTRDDALRAMVEDLERTYQSMPTATRAECTDRATMRALIKRASSGESSAGRGVVARAPVRALSRETRRGRQAQANSLRRLQQAGLLERLAEPTQAVEKHGAAYLLYASDTERAFRGQGRREATTGRDTKPHEEKTNNNAQGEDPRRYAGLYESVHFTRA